MKTIAKLALTSLLAFAIVGTAVEVQAQDKPVAAKKDKAQPAGEKKRGAIPYHGKLAALDKNAKTVTLADKRTFQITESTKIRKDDKQATLEDAAAAVGQQVRGQYKKTDEGELELVSLMIGPKPEGEGAKKRKEK